MNTKTHVTRRKMNEKNDKSSTLAIWFTSNYTVDIFVNCECCLGNINESQPAVFVRKKKYINYKTATSCGLEQRVLHGKSMSLTVCKTN